MSDTAQITARFEEPSVRADAYWIRLTKEPTKPETVTFTEAAKVIDSIFDVDACTPNFSLSGDSVNVDEINVEAKLREGFSLIEYEPCKFSSKNLDFIAFVYVFRSHIDETYNLVLTNGNVLRTERESMSVDILHEITDTKYVSLEYSINGDLSCSSEVESYSGSMITLKNKFTGFLRIKYTTQFDKVKIKVYGNGENEEPVGCKCIAFYKGMATDIFIDPPEIDILAVEKIGCDDERAEEEERESLEDEDKDDSEPEEDGDEDEEEPPPDEDEEEPPPDPDPDSEDGDGDEGGIEDRPYGTCYQRVIVQKKCMCSEKQEDSYDYAEEIPCPPPGSLLSGNTTPAAAYENWWENRKVVVRVNCGEEDDVADKEYFKEKCCKYPENMDPKVSLPLCKTRKRTWFGPVAFDFDAFYGSGDLVSRWNYNEEGVNIAREKIELIPVNPENASAVGINKLICGEIITEQQVNARNCCDPEVTPPIIYDDENSVEVISDNSYGLIFWEGGVPPFDLKINGQGFYLDNNRMFKSMTIASPGWTYIDDVGYWSAIVYTDDACGMGNIQITDGCTSASGQIRATDGQWELVFSWVGSSTTPDFGSQSLNWCPISGSGERLEGDWYYTLISGEYKLEEGADWCAGISVEPCCAVCEAEVEEWIENSRNLCLDDRGVMLTDESCITQNYLEDGAYITTYCEYIGPHVSCSEYPGMAKCRLQGGVIRLAYKRIWEWKC